MGWMQKLFETYEQCAGNEPSGSEKLLPISHSVQQAHLEITIDAKGVFMHAKIVKKEETVIPVTEDSAGRTGRKCAPHPLCDKVQYCAADYQSRFGGEKPSFYDSYEKQLSNWCKSDYSHPKAQAVLAYIRKGHVVGDLVGEGLLHIDQHEKLFTEWTGEEPVPEIFKLLATNPDNGKRDQGNAFIRWNVIEEGDPCIAVWEDRSLQKAWINYDSSTDGHRDLCMVIGTQQFITGNHPKRIRHAGDGAKLISANDGSGYTFRGRFTDGTGRQACGVSKVVSQKAHYALRWLINRQGFKNNEQVIVAWAISGQEIPDPFENTFSLFSKSESFISHQVHERHQTDVGQAFALRLCRALAGYRSQLDDSDGIVVMGMDSATPGRMAVTFYRELQVSDFLNRIQVWHERFAWHQLSSKGISYIGTPSPRDIVEAAYGNRIDDKLRKSINECLLPCIIDQLPMPRYLVNSVVRRSCNRQSFSSVLEWEKTLGIACALHKGLFNENSYDMTLEKNRNTPDYLYGRLLAIAENIEEYALNLSGEKRETTAARYMQRFADRPFSTWKNIELALSPYKTRFYASEKSLGFLKNRQRLIDEVVCSFNEGDFSRENDRPLNGEFLLGFHCQRNVFRPVKATDTSSQQVDSIENHIDN
ncbi:MAG: type I-C CRISPR-associated protein Cas8c/Csd1 [Desulfobulbaceae bacterium]|nr:type I-C CRISPR-associated protein Cas8c/Csd1 [Desulfobulbaceae bacterium]